MNNLSNSDLIVNHNPIYRDEAGRLCEPHLAVECSNDSGKTWNGPPTREEHRKRIVKKIARFLKKRMRGSTHVELRVLGIPGHNGTHAESGIFTDATKMAETAYDYSGRAKGVYYCINPVGVLPSEDMEFNKMNWGRAIKDENILNRTTLFIDIDAERSEKDQPASQAEKDIAFDTANKISDYLTELGWPKPVFCDSGNGFYLLYNINLPADDGGIVRRILKALAHKFGRAVDHTVCNASRISRVPYTWNIKGDDTIERPHRLAYVKEYPDTDTVPTELLTALADTWQEPEAAADNSTRVQFGSSSSYSGNIPDDERARRAASYVDRMPESVSGRGGHMALWNAANMIFVGFAVPESMGREILDRFNDRCRPRWSNAELNHKIRDVLTKNRLPMGFKLDESDRRRSNSCVKIEEPIDEINAALGLHLQPVKISRSTRISDRGRALGYNNGELLANNQKRSEKWGRCPRRFSAFLSKGDAEFSIYLSCKQWDCPECSKHLKEHWIENFTELFSVHTGPLYIFECNKSECDTIRRYAKYHGGECAFVDLPGGLMQVVSSAPPKRRVDGVSPAEALDRFSETIRGLPLCRKPIHTTRAWQMPKKPKNPGGCKMLGVRRLTEPEEIKDLAKDFGVEMFRERAVHDPDGKIFFIQSWRIPKTWTQEQIDNWHRHLLGHALSFRTLSREDCQEVVDYFAALDLPETG